MDLDTHGLQHEGRDLLQQIRRDLLWDARYGSLCLSLAFFSDTLFTVTEAYMREPLPILQRRPGQEDSPWMH